MNNEYRRIVQLSIASVVLSAYSIYAFSEVDPILKNISGGENVVPIQNGVWMRLPENVQNNASSQIDRDSQDPKFHEGLEGFPDQTGYFENVPTLMFDNVDRGEAQEERRRLMSTYTQMAVLAIRAARTQSGSSTPKVQSDVEISDIVTGQTDLIFNNVQKYKSTPRKLEITEIRQTQNLSEASVTEFIKLEDRNMNIPVAIHHQEARGSNLHQDMSAAPLTAIRPAARPDRIASHVSSYTDSLASQEKTETHSETISVTLLSKDHIQVYSNSSHSTGVIVGVFETPHGQWALLENESGEISLLREGDRAGNRTVLKIKNGNIILNDNGGDIFLQTGDTL